MNEKLKRLATSAKYALIAIAIFAIVCTLVCIIHIGLINGCGKVATIIIETVIAFCGLTFYINRDLTA